MRDEQLLAQHVQCPCAMNLPPLHVPLLQYGQKMGWVRTDVTAHALGVFVQGHALSRILVDLDHNQLEAESWEKVMKLTFDVIFTPPTK